MERIKNINLATNYFIKGNAMYSKNIDYIPQDGEIEELRQRIAGIRDTVQASLLHADNELMPHFVYNSVNIAGNRTSRANTIRILKADDNTADPESQASLEIIGLRDAYSKMLEIANDPVITPQHIAELHRLLYYRINDVTAGRCRPDTEKRNYEMELENFMEWLNGSYDADCFHSAATAYRRYIYMHPFKGGNGHMARLILALKMHRHGYTAIVIPNKWKTEYDGFIKNYDEETFVNFLKKCSFATMNIIVANLGTTYSDRKTRHIRGINPEEEILEHIRKNPGVKSIQMKKNFPKISYTKMTRIIRNLREEGKIEFKGATKSGGYYAASEGEKPSV